MSACGGPVLGLVRAAFHSTLKLCPSICSSLGSASRPPLGLPPPTKRMISNVRALSHPTTSTPSQRIYGQPLPSTHPHLLAPGELTVGITAQEYEDRRRRLMDGLEEGSVVVIAGGRLKYMSGEIFYQFRQASDFWYLTGWEEPDSILVLEKNGTSRGFRMTMFCPSKDANQELWIGAISGREGAVEVFQAHEASDISLLSAKLRSILDPNSNGPIYISLPGIRPSSHALRTSSKFRSFLDHLVPRDSTLPAMDDLTGILSGLKGNRPIRSAAIEVERLRVKKSEAEIRLLKKAADISSQGHVRVMHVAEPTSPLSPITEHTLVTEFEYTTAKRGSPRPAYVPVCASGLNGMTIHYTHNNMPLISGDLILFDAGCEYGGYASDITRTFPVNGKFTSAQSHLYEAVLRVEKACIELCTQETSMTLDDLHRRSADLMRVELKDLGFHLRGNDLERRLYPHFVGHPLGIDLHDTPSFKRDQKLTAGMVVTIEPGLFIPPDSNYPSHFHNMAVRVEDEVLVGLDTYTVLSEESPKEIVDIERACQEGF